MENLVLTANVVNWSASFSAFEKGRRWDGAVVLFHQVLQQCEHKLLAVNLVSWHAVL